MPHQRLLKKVESYGVEGSTLRWLEDFLLGRHQQVTVNKATSAREKVISGVPQGSVLGPILFLLYINDLPDYITSHIKIFADDTKIFKSIQDIRDCEELQSDLTNLEKWASDWQMTFHPQKCEVLRIGGGHPQFTYSMFPNGSTAKLTSVDVVKDLGVHIDRQLSFDYHCNEAVKKAHKILATIRRTFVHIDSSNMIPLYKSLVRPYLEYAEETWSPKSKKNIRLLESVQRRATKLIPEISHVSYEERLKHLKLPSLVYRRHRGDMINVFKYMNNIWDTTDNLFMLSRESRTRGHSQKLFKERWDTALRGQFFSNRVINLWNSLPVNLMYSKDVNSFKIGLDRHWESQPWLYDFENDS